MPTAYEQAARFLDLRNLSPQQVVMVNDFIRQYAPDGSVYAAYSAPTALIKIGRSEDVPRRLGTLARQYGTPLRLLASVYCPCAVAAVERWLHTHFQSSCVSGEWFDCDPVLFMEPCTFQSLVQDAHYDILRKIWYDLIVQKLVGSWVLDREMVRLFMSL